MAFILAFPSTTVFTIPFAPLAFVVKFPATRVLVATVDVGVVKPLLKYTFLAVTFVSLAVNELPVVTTLDALSVTKSITALGLFERSEEFAI